MNMEFDISHNQLGEERHKWYRNRVVRPLSGGQNPTVYEMEDGKGEWEMSEDRRNGGSVSEGEATWQKRWKRGGNRESGMGRHWFPAPWVLFAHGCLRAAATGVDVDGAPQGSSSIPRSICSGRCSRGLLHAAPGPRDTGGSPRPTADTVIVSAAPLNSYQYPAGSPLLASSATSAAAWHSRPSGVPVRTPQ